MLTYFASCITKKTLLNHAQKTHLQDSYIVIATFLKMLLNIKRGILLKFVPRIGTDVNLAMSTYSLFSKHYQDHVT